MTLHALPDVDEPIEAAFPGVFDLATHAKALEAALRSARVQLRAAEASVMSARTGVDERIAVALEEARSEIASTTAERDETVAERDGVIVERDRAIAQRDRGIAERDGVIAERDRVVAERHRVVAERDRVVAERDEAIAERDRLAQALAQWEASAAAAIADLEIATQTTAELRAANAAMRDELGAAQAAVLEGAAIAETAKIAAAERAAEYAALTARYVGLIKEFTEATERIARSTAHEIDLIQSGRFWRLKRFVGRLSGRGGPTG